MTRLERNKRKEWMLELFNSGLTYREIGEVAGISKQRVFQIIGNTDRTRFRDLTKEQCVFEGLRRYLNENRISIVALTRKIYGDCGGATYSRLKSALKSSKGLITMAKINQILSVTGLTYEEAFLSQGE